MSIKSLKSIFILVLGLSLLSQPAAAKAKKVGEMFPLINVKDLSGKSDRKMASLIKGNTVTIIDFWASWCGPCGEAMPALDAIHQKFKGQKFAVIGVNVDDKPATPEVKALASKVKFPLVYDPGKKLATEAGVQTMPSSFVLDSKGKIIYIHKGFRSGDEVEIEKQVMALLKK
jgi:thiol-disulfide isomerase/thioredoxin